MTDLESAAKPCTKCAGFFAKTEFAKDKSKKDGLACWCKKCKKTASANDYLANIADRRQKRATYRALHRTNAKSYAEKYYRENSVDVIKKAIIRQKLNPEKNRISTQNYNAKKRKNGGILSKNLTTYLYKIQKGLCPCCNIELGSDYHLDHIIPIHLGGENVDSNIQLLRATCNHQKSSKHPVDFMQSRGFLL